MCVCVCIICVVVVKKKECGDEIRMCRVFACKRTKKSVAATLNKNNKRIDLYYREISSVLLLSLLTFFSTLSNERRKEEGEIR